MTFNINQLDDIEYDGSAEATDALEDYIDSIINEFAVSSEGETHLKIDPKMGFWIANLIDYGHIYLGAALPQMTEDDIDEIVADIFPKKITLSSPDEADDVIPELLAFWCFLKREYRLSNADEIIENLVELEPEFNAIMNDPTKFGMAKTFMTMGQNAGFDMLDENQLNEFTRTYNEQISSGQINIPLENVLSIPEFLQSRKTKAKAKAKKKQKKKRAKASRRKAKKKR